MSRRSPLAIRLGLCSVLACILIPLQAYLIARMVAQISPATSLWVVWFAHLVGFGFLMGLVALIERFGLGSGFALLLFVPGVEPLLETAALGLQMLRVHPPTVLGMVSVPGLVFALLKLRAWSESRTDSTLPVPASGLIPLSVAGALCSVLLAAASLELIPVSWTTIWSDRGTLSLPALVASTLVLTPLFVWLFNPPRAVGSLRDRVGLLPVNLSDARRTSALVIFGLAGLQALPLVTQLHFDYLYVVLIAAVVFDIYHEWTARSLEPSAVLVWTLHRPYAVAPSLERLQQAGLSPFATSVNYRAWTHFFGPFVPIKIFVPASEQEPARRSLAELLAVDTSTLAEGSELASSEA